jgi:hypothetical protein
MIQGHTVADASSAVVTDQYEGLNGVNIESLNLGRFRLKLVTKFLVFFF